MDRCLESAELRSCLRFLENPARVHSLTQHRVTVSELTALCHHGLRGTTATAHVMVDSRIATERCIVILLTAAIHVRISSWRPKAATASPAADMTVYFQIGRIGAFARQLVALAKRHAVERFSVSAGLTDMVAMTCWVRSRSASMQWSAKLEIARGVDGLVGVTAPVPVMVDFALESVTFRRCQTRTAGNVMLRSRKALNLATRKSARTPSAQTGFGVTGQTGHHALCPATEVQRSERAKSLSRPTNAAISHRERAQRPGYAK
mmetsp:Transcript_59779/g.142657  ORF Transcript_59779/g.142657 Transcript_59779/m.142657 type:complete len:263 (+) Transcript_59779:2943-3731(+)